MVIAYALFCALLFVKYNKIDTNCIIFLHI